MLPGSVLQTVIITIGIPETTEYYISITKILILENHNIIMASIYLKASL